MTVRRHTHAKGLMRAVFPKKIVSESAQNVWSLFRFVVKYRSVVADAGISRSNHSVIARAKDSGTEAFEEMFVASQPLPVGKYPRQQLAPT